METKRVVAIRDGWYGDRIVKPGEEFVVPAKAKASWFKDVEPPKQPDKPGEKK